MMGADRDQLAAAGLCPHLHRAGSLEQVHGLPRFGHRGAHGQQAVIAQHQVLVLAEVAHQPRLLVLVERETFVVVIAEVAEHEGRLLRDRQQSRLLRRHRDAFERMHVQHATGVLARGMNRAVNGVARRIDRVRRLSTLLPSRSIRTRLDAVISSNMKPYGLIRKSCGPGTRAEMCVNTRSSQPKCATSRYAAARSTRAVAIPRATVVAAAGQDERCGTHGVSSDGARRWHGQYNFQAVGPSPPGQAMKSPHPDHRGAAPHRFGGLVLAPVAAVA